MNDVLDTIERELMVAVRRGNARRRRRRTLGIFSGAVVAVGLTTGAAIAALTGTPIERLFGSDMSLSKPPGAPRVDLRVTDPGGLGWTVVTYKARDGSIATVTAADGVRVKTPAVGGRNGYAIADGLLRFGPVAGAELDVVRVRGRDHYLLAGTVEANVERVVVVLGGRSRTATLSRKVVGAPVVKRMEDLTEEGRAIAARLPDEVRLRTYAATLVPDALAGEVRVKATVVWTLADGSTGRWRSMSFCVSRVCGARAPEAAGQGRAG